MTWQSQNNDSDEPVVRRTFAAGPGDTPYATRLYLSYLRDRWRRRTEPVESMPGIFQLSINHAVAEAKQAYDLGVSGVLLFGIPDEKDEAASGAYDPEGIIQLATRAIKTLSRSYSSSQTSASASIRATVIVES